LEQTGRLYEAVRFYKRAVLLVPDIEYRAFQYTAAATTADGRERGGVRNDNEKEMVNEWKGPDENGNKNCAEVSGQM
jgi:hypothetical protein